MRLGAKMRVTKQLICKKCGVKIEAPIHGSLRCYICYAQDKANAKIKFNQKQAKPKEIEIASIDMTNCCSICEKLLNENTSKAQFCDETCNKIWWSRKIKAEKCWWQANFNPLKADEVERIETFEYVKISNKPIRIKRDKNGEITDKALAEGIHQLYLLQQYNMRFDKKDKSVEQ
jgi:hypothetical protein